VSGSPGGDHRRNAVVAVDVGGTSMKAGVLGPAGCHELRRVPTARERGPDAVVTTIAETVLDLDEWCRAHRLDVVGACVAVPGIVDDDRGIAELSVNLGWRDCPLRDLVDPRRGYPVVLAHDVRAGAVAESTFGAAAGTASAMFLPIGTGLAAATVVDGVIHLGATHQAGEIGQVLIDPPATGVNGGERVTLERVSSARAIADRYQRASGRHDVGPAEVLARSDSGDEIAVAVVSEAMRSLGKVIAAAVATIDPGMVVLGGGLTSDSEVLARRLADALADELPWRQPPPVATARFSADAGFVGTALLAWQRAAGRAVAELADALSPEWTGVPVAVPT
jgi:glucokinase